MNNRERFINKVLGERVDRNCFYLFWPPWKTAMSRWLIENKGSFKRTDYTDEVIFLNEEIYPLFKPDIPPRTLSLNCGPFPVKKELVLHEDKDYITFIDNWGVKKRDYKKRESMSEFLSFPVKDKGSWEKFRDERLDPDDPDRMIGNWEDEGFEWMKEGFPIQIGGYPDVGVFGAYRWLMGDEEGLIAFKTQPELVDEIMDHLTTLYLSVFKKVVKKIRVDVIHLFEDIACRQGPLFSPEHFERFMAPNYKRIKRFADDNGIPVFSMDTDGDFIDLMPSIINAGVDLISPVEVAAGMDINKLLDVYPDIGFMGGIDKRVLSRGKKDIDEELFRISRALRNANYIPFLDHLIPDDVPWRNYCYYARQLKKMINIT